MCRRVYVTPWCPACLTPGEPRKTETRYCWATPISSYWVDYSPASAREEWRPPRADYVCRPSLSHRLDTRREALARQVITVESGITSDDSPCVTLRLNGNNAEWISPDRCWNCMMEMLDRANLPSQAPRGESEKYKGHGPARKEYTLPLRPHTKPEPEQAVGGTA